MSGQLKECNKCYGKLHMARVRFLAFVRNGRILPGRNKIIKEFYDTSSA